MSIEAGVLYVVATPIGNLGDISRRALEVLGGVQIVAAEDTRHSARLLRHYGITTRSVALHEHNEREMVPRIIAKLRSGQSVALVSDAGTPLVSDPGYMLVAEARAQGLRVVPVPGPSALVAALSAAGLPTDRFTFEGFLPPRTEARRRRLRDLAEEPRTLIFYESPHRVEQALVDMAQVLGEQRRAVLARELTKVFEEIHGDTLAGLLVWLRQSPERCKGEFVLLLAGAEPPADDAPSAADERLLRALLRELPVSRAAALAAEVTGRKKNVLYQKALKMAESE